jgi:hypothetical protein
MYYNFSKVERKPTQRSAAVLTHQQSMQAGRWTTAHSNSTAPTPTPPSRLAAGQCGQQHTRTTLPTVLLMQVKLK